jgi:hypothetical protein
VIVELHDGRSVMMRREQAEAMHDTQIVYKTINGIERAWNFKQKSAPPPVAADSKSVAGVAAASDPFMKNNGLKSPVSKDEKTGAAQLVASSTPAMSGASSASPKQNKPSGGSSKKQKNGKKSTSETTATASTPSTSVGTSSPVISKLNQSTADSSAAATPKS